MKIEGILLKKIKEGKAVLFLGAGVGQAIGLYGTSDLAKHIFIKAGAPDEYKKYETTLMDLVARLDKDSKYSRSLVNDILKEYFLDPSNYKNLSLVERLLKFSWHSIVTTNYDISLELVASNYNYSGIKRLLPICNPEDKILITNTDSNKLKYFKIHGCAEEMYRNPINALPFVITEPDFRKRAIKNKAVWNYLEDAAYHNAIIFIGFNANKHERVIQSVFEAQNALRNNFQESFRTYAILKNIDEDTAFKLEDLDIELIDGGFEDFVDALESIQDVHFKGKESESDSILVKNGLSETVSYSSDEISRNESQFTVFYNGLFDYLERCFSALDKTRAIDRWKNKPTPEFIFSNRIIRRSCQSDIVRTIEKRINKNTRDKISSKILLWGDRGCGKTILVNQVAKEIYLKNGSPILMLNSEATYIENNGGKETLISGWDARLIDKFLSKFHRNENSSAIMPIVIADNMFFKFSLIEKLETFLSNHGKNCLLIITASKDEYEEHLRLSKKPIESIEIPHQLDRQEISLLFDSVQKENEKFNVYNKLEMIERAIVDAKQDILLTLFMWFDKNLRRLEDIVEEEAQKIKDAADSNVKNLYCCIAIFQQFYLPTRISLCARALGISISEYTTILQDGLFKALVTIEGGGDRQHGYTRHAEYTRRLLHWIIPDQNDQIDLICKVIKVARSIDTDFVRSFFSYLFHSKISFSMEQVTKLKMASEENVVFRTDSVLNHQFAAFLIRENADLDMAEYYIDLALVDDYSKVNPAIIHTKGNLQFAKFRKLQDLEYYETAKEYFDRVRTLSPIPEEHDYVTEIDMITNRIDNFEEPVGNKALLESERSALLYEAINVIPKEHQDYLSDRVKLLRPFEHMSDNKQAEIVNNITNGTASHLLIKFYTDSLFVNPSNKKWERLKFVYEKYFSAKSDIATVIIVGAMSKKAFLSNSQKRFELLRTFYDSVIRHREAKISFPLVSEYIKLISIDAFVLKKFDFLRQSIADLRETFSSSFPKYLKEEYILNDEYYLFKEDDIDFIKKSYFSNSQNFEREASAKRFKKDSVFINTLDPSIYYNVEMDPYSKFFIRGIKKELYTKSNRVSINFCIRYAFDGFKITSPELI
jgi:GTPase SAR1 family protein